MFIKIISKILLIPGKIIKWEYKLSYQTSFFIKEEKWRFRQGNLHVRMIFTVDSMHFIFSCGRNAFYLRALYRIGFVEPDWALYPVDLVSYLLPLQMKWQRVREVNQFAQRKVSRFRASYSSLPPGKKIAVFILWSFFLKNISKIKYKQF